MAKSVQLSEAAYRALATRKEKGESFSDVVLRILSWEKDPLALLNLGPLRPDFDFEASRREIEEEHARRMRQFFGPDWEKRQREGD